MILVQWGFIFIYLFPLNYSESLQWINEVLRLNVRKREACIQQRNAIDLRRFKFDWYPGIACIQQFKLLASYSMTALTFAWISTQKKRRLYTCMKQTNSRICGDHLDPCSEHLLEWIFSLLCYAGLEFFHFILLHLHGYLPWSTLSLQTYKMNTGWWH